MNTSKTSHYHFFYFPESPAGIFESTLKSGRLSVTSLEHGPSLFGALEQGMKKGERCVFLAHNPSIARQAKNLAPGAAVILYSVDVSSATLLQQEGIPCVAATGRTNDFNALCNLAFRHDYDSAARTNPSRVQPVRLAAIHKSIVHCN